MFDEQDEDLASDDAGGGAEPSDAVVAPRKTALDFSSFAEPVDPAARPPAKGGRAALDFSSGAERVAGPIKNPPLPKRRPQLEVFGDQETPDTVDMPLPKPRPDIGSPAPDDYAAPLEDAPFRTGGSALDSALAPESGMLTGDEAYAENQSRIAGATTAVQTAKAERLAAQQRLDALRTEGFATGILRADEAQAGTADPRLVRRALTLAQRREREAEGALQAAKKASLPTQGTARNLAESAIGTAAQMGADTLTGLRGVTEAIPGPLDWLNPEASKVIGDLKRAITDNVDTEAKRVAKPDPAKAEDPSTQITSGAVSMGMFMAGGLAARALGASAAMGAGGIGAMQQGGSQMAEAENAIKVLDGKIEQARANGVDARPLEAQRDTLLKTKYVALFAGMGLGATEAIPIERFFNRLNQVSNGRVGAIIANSTAQSMEEMLQEIGQQIGSNTVARLLYDEGRDIFKDVNQSAGVALVLGGLMGGVAGAAQKRRGKRDIDVPLPVQPSADEIQQSFEPEAPAPAQNEPVAPIAAQPTEQPTPQGPVSAIERRVLRKKGYQDDQIDGMSRAEAQAELGEAAQQGVEAGADEVPQEQPSAEPVGDITAQVGDLKAGKRQAVWLPKATVDHLTEVGELDGVMDAGTFLDNFDGQGGMLLVPDRKAAADAIARRNQGDDFQALIGELTGDGQGKPPGADTVVQQRDEQGNVTQERLVTQDEIAPVSQDFAEPGRTVEVKPATDALAERADRVEGEKHDFSDQATPVKGDGTKQSPAVVHDPADIERIAGNVNTKPSEAQVEAGNYKKGHLKWKGLDIAIENPAGSIRSGKKPDGTPWNAQLPVAYGYIKRTQGKDNDQVDVYLQGDGPIHVIDQIDPATGKFDEHKVIIGPANAEEAIALYRSAFDDKGAVNRIGAVTELDLKHLKAWLRIGKRTRPLGKIAKPETPAKDQFDAGFDAGMDDAFGATSTEKTEVNQNSEAVIDAKENVEEAINIAGMSPSVVDPADIQKAAEIVATTGADPGQAFVEVMAAQIEEQANADTSADQPGHVPASVEGGAEGGQQDQGEQLSGGGEAGDQSNQGDTAGQAGKADFSDQADPADSGAGAEAEDEGVKTGYVETAIDKPADKPRIEDAGEKIGGARKDQWSSGGMQPHDLDDMSGAERHKFVTKEQVWPRLDYAQLVEDGVEPEAAFLIKAIYDRIPTMPQGTDLTLAKQQQYITVLNAVRAGASEVKTVADVRALKNKVLEELTGQTREWGTETFGVVMPRRNGRISSYDFPAEPNYRDYTRAAKAVKEGFPNLEPWQRFMEVHQWAEDQFVVYRGKGRGRTRLSGSHKTKEEANAAAKAFYENMDKGADDQGKEPKRPHLDNIRRVGPDIRQGRDVDSKDFISDFGFRGVEFGNWVAGDERQKAINLAYDALHDLARLFGLPPKAISLNGTLGVAFGARGHGGKVAAHYEPHRLAINMTKINGAGSLAHEWGHALDHYLGEVDAPNSYGGAPKSISRWRNISVNENTYSNNPLKNLSPRLNRTANALMQALHFKHETDEQQKIRQEETDQRGSSGLKSWEKEAERVKELLRKGGNTRGLHARLRKAEQQIEVWTRSNERRKRAAEGKDWVQTDYYRAAKHLSGSGDYWHRPNEMFARAFESYVFDKLANEGDGHVSQYLVQGVEPDRFGNGYKGNPYPSGDERTTINAAFDAFVKALQVTEGKHGEGSKLTGKTVEEPVVETVEPVKPVTTEQKKDQLQDEMKALDQSTDAMADGSETVNRTAVLAVKFASHLRDGGEFGNILAARKMARESGFDGDAKAVEEAMELAVVQLAREIAADRSDPKANFTALVDLYSRQPKLGTRTSTSMRDQAFSTPIPLAYVASRLAGITPDTSVYEPSAGNGALLIEATPANVDVNEISPGRAENLAGQGFSVSREDASIRKAATPEFDRVIANPPFGAVRQEDQSQVFNLADIQNGYRTNEIDHAIALRALQRMIDKGRAVLILGGLNKLAASRESRSDGYNSKAKREFYKTLYDRYNVTDHFTVAGELYERQGAGWPVDVIVIEGRGKSSRKLPAVDVPRVLTAWDQLGGLIDGTVSGRSDGQADRSPDRDAEGGAGQRDERVRGGGERVSERIPATVEPGDVQPGSDERAASADREGQQSPRDERGDAERTGVEPDAERRPPELKGFDQAFDNALDETFGPQAGPKSLEGKAAAKSFQEARAGIPQNDEQAERWKKLGIDKRATGDIAKSAGKNIAGSADDAMAGLVQLFGGGKTTGMGIAFDPDTYAKAKPLFIQAAQKFAAFKDDVTELVRRMVGEMQRLHGLTRDALEAMRPYLRRFMEEVQSGVVRLTPAKVAKETKAATPTTTEQETDKQVAYAPQSTVRGLGTLVPVNMRASIAESLAALEKRVGPLDEYVASELGYETADLERYFAAEQIDALGLSIDNLTRGKGFIIGDQTGIGKGRVNAAIIRWAIKQGRIPVFVTEKPNLYRDMYRDLADIGISDDFLDGPPRILATNSALNVPLTEDDRAQLKTQGSKEHGQLLGKLTSESFTDKFDMVFTTYNQMQTLKGEDTIRRAFLDRIAPDAVLIFDESHNAGGQGQAAQGWKKKGAPQGRSGFARALVEKANGVFYSSATYAKRPDVMDLYAATDMVLAVEKKEDLGEAIAKGGVPMQQVVASMLAKAGQYIRRERSFAGVSYDTPVIAVNHEQYDGISQALALIQDFSVEVQDAAVAIDEDVKSQAAAIIGDNSTGEAGASSVLFTSIMHNIINQMLLAMKAGPVAQKAIEAIRNNQKPVITLANTMESFLDQYASQEGINPGGVLDADFSRVLVRYLDRTRTLIIKKPFADKASDKIERRYLSDMELGPSGRSAYDRAKAQIESLVLSDLPVSPIDRIKQDLIEAGYKVGEITGRGTIIDYSDPGKPVLRNRPGNETSIRGRLDTITKFNRAGGADGGYDAIIMNQSGATGLSLHASATFKDQRQRHMMIAQAEANIDTHMQMLGRVHRTGQVVVPTYSQLVADIPAEKRPAAVLAKKMASLNANTTASRGGALTAKDVPDFINEYGDVIAATIIADDLVLNHRLGNAVKIDDNGKVTLEDAMRRVTGRIPLLPLAEQEELYDRLEADYDALLEQKAAMGENALEAQTLDLKAKPVKRTEVVPKKSDSASPFAMPVHIEKTSIVRQGKPFSAQELMHKVLSQLSADIDEQQTIPPDQDMGVLLGDLETDRGEWGRKSAVKERTDRYAALGLHAEFERGILQDTAPDKTEKERLKLNAVKDRWAAIHETLRIGARITLKTDNGNITAIVLKIEQTGATKNPLALSSWKATFAVADAARQVTLPFSRLYENGKSPSDESAAIEVAPIGWVETPAQTIERFASMQSGSREERFIATGNLLAAYDWLSMKGRIINYTDEAGHIRQGILTAKDFDLGKHYAQKARPLRDPAEVVAWLKNNRNQIMWSEDDVVRLTLDQGRFHVSVEAAKRTGGVYFLDKDLTELTRDFYKRGSVMTTDIYDPGDALMKRIVERLQALGAVFVDKNESKPPPTEKLAQATKDAELSVAPKGWDTVEAGSAWRLTDDEIATVKAIIRRVAAVEPAMVEKIIIPAGSPGAKAWGMTEDGQAQGMYQSALDIITIALTFAGPRTAYHEAFHRLQHRLLSEQELAVLGHETQRLRDMLRNDIAGRDADKMDRKEVEAEAFAAYAMNRELGAGLSGALRRAWSRLEIITRRIRNALHGLGYQTVEDIFGRAYSGEIAQRQPRSAVANDGPQFSIRRRAGRAGDTVPAPENVRDALAQIDKPFKERLSDAIDALLLSPARAIWDRQIDLLRFQKGAEAVDGSIVPQSLDTYLAATLYPGRAGERMKDAVKQLWEPVYDAMRDRHVGRDELHDYLYARHAPERNAQIREIDPDNDAGSGMTDDEAAEIMGSFIGREADFAAIAAMIDGVVSHNRGVMLREGLESETTLDKWSEAYQFYVPLKGFEAGDDSDVPGSPSSGRGFDVRRPETYRALGRFDRAGDILANLLDQTQRTIIRAEKNRVAKTFLRFAQANPSPFYRVGLAEVKRRINPLTGLVEEYWANLPTQLDRIFAAKVGGKTYYMEIKHDGLLEALKSLGADKMNPFLRVLSRLTREYSRFQTAKNPEFVFTNLARDLQDAGFTLSGEQQHRLFRRYAANMAKGKSLYGAVLGITEKGEHREARRWFEEWRADGGKISHYGLKDLETIRKEIEKELTQRTESTAKTIAMAAPRMLNPINGKMVKFLEALSDITETTTRLAVYIAAREVGMTRAHAARLSRNATVDFNRRGKYGTVINALYAFANANIQGNIRLIRTLRKSKIARRATVGIVVAGYLMTMWNMAMSPEDEEKKRGYEKRKYWERERNIIIYWPGAQHAFKMPLGYGLNVFWMMGEQLALRTLGKVKTLPMIGNLLGTMVDAFNPTGSQGSFFDLATWAKGLFPTVLRPVPELALNKDWAGRPVHPDQMPWTEGIPHSSQHKALTHPAAVAAAEFMNRLSGGNRFEPGWASLYPDDIEYGWNFAVGGLGRFLANSSGTIADYVDGVDRPVERIPFVRRFVASDNSPSVQSDAYYEKRREEQTKARRLRSAIKARQDGTDDGTADAVIERLAQETGARPGRNNRGVSVATEREFANADKQLKELRQQMDTIRKDQSLQRSQKAERIEGIRKEMRDIMGETRSRIPAPAAP